MKTPYFQSLLELAGIVFHRFPPLQRTWVVLLVIVNALALLFIDTRYAQAALVSVLVGILIMGVIYSRQGFVRLLGIGHFLWIALIPWLIYELPKIDRTSWLYTWVVALILFNSICFIVDMIDVARYFRGERQPHYTWKDHDRK